MLRLRRTFAILGSAALLATALPAHAYYEAPWSSFDFLTDQRWTQINNRITDQNMRIMRESASRSRSNRADGDSNSATTTTAPDLSALALGSSASTDLSRLGEHLAASHMNTEQAATVLEIYRRAAESLDVPANDTASGIIALIAGSYAGYTNQPFPDEAFKPLYEQFAPIIAADPTLMQLPQAERVEYYQRMVLAGMLFQLAQIELQKNPDPAQIDDMRDSAYKVFSGITGRSPDAVQFTSQGMSAR